MSLALLPPGSGRLGWLGPAREPSGREPAVSATRVAQMSKTGQLNGPESSHGRRSCQSGRSGRSGRSCQLSGCPAGSWAAIWRLFVRLVDARRADKPTSRQPDKPARREAAKPVPSVRSRGQPARARLEPVWMGKPGAAGRRFKSGPVRPGSGAASWLQFVTISGPSVASLRANIVTFRNCRRLESSSRAGDKTKSRQLTAP